MMQSADAFNADIGQSVSGVGIDIHFQLFETFSKDLLTGGEGAAFNDVGAELPADCLKLLSGAQRGGFTVINELVGEIVVKLQFINGGLCVLDGGMPERVVGVGN